MKIVEQNREDIAREMGELVDQAAKAVPGHDAYSYEEYGQAALLTIAAELRTIRQLLEEKAK